MTEPKDKPAIPELELANDPFAKSSPYELLGVDRDADVARVKSAFRAIQRRARRDDTSITPAREAMEALTTPRTRLAIDLLTVKESRLHQEIVRRYGEIDFTLEPGDLVPLLMQASDLEWSGADDDFETPPVPRVVFESMLPSPTREHELVVPDRKK